MKHDFELIKHKFGRGMSEMNIYPIGDLHVGSTECNLAMWLKWKEIVLADPNGYVVIVGDMLDNTLKNSKGNCYDNAMSPRQAKEFLLEELRPLKDRILGVVQGNHCYRSTMLTGDCPLYDIMCKLDLEDLYRENMAFIKVNLGQRKKDRQCSYVFTLAHGGSRNKVSNFGYSIDGTDVFVTGHTHSPECDFPAKIVVDSHNEVVRIAEFTHVTVPSYQMLGGYALKGLYTPKSNTKFPVIKLSGEKKDVSVLWRN